MTENTMNLTLFEQLGGDAVINAAVKIFYHKILDDYRINRFFSGVDMSTQATKQRMFLTMLFGGLNNYSGQDMRRGHAKFVKIGLNDSHFDVIMEHLKATLSELNISQDLIDQSSGNH